MRVLGRVALSALNISTGIVVAEGTDVSLEDTQSLPKIPYGERRDEPHDHDVHDSSSKVEPAPDQRAFEEKQTAHLRNLALKSLQPEGEGQAGATQDDASGSEPSFEASRARDISARVPHVWDDGPVIQPAERLPMTHHAADGFSAVQGSDARDQALRHMPVPWEPMQHDDSRMRRLFSRLDRPEETASPWFPQQSHGNPAHEPASDDATWNKESSFIPGASQAFQSAATSLSEVAWALRWRIRRTLAARSAASAAKERPAGFVFAAVAAGLMVEFLIIMGAFVAGARSARDSYLQESLATQQPEAESRTSDASAHDQDGDGVDDQTDILDSARAYLATHPTYGSAYYQGGWPDDGRGVCTDVVAAALLGAGYDLRELVHEDIKKDPDAYPVETPDPNIDYRRVKNLRIWFGRNAVSLTLDPYKTDEWQGGDIVCYDDHIAVVSDHRNKKGLPYLIHLRPGDQKKYEENRLVGHGEILGHWRMP